MVGLGRMGSAMARVVSGAGFETTVWNRNPERSEIIAQDTGVRVAGSAADAAAGADVVITSLADGPAVRHVYLGPGGIVEGISSHAVALEASTIDIDTVTDVGRAVDGVAAGFLDSPVSGSVATVEAGALTFMVGGDPDLLDRVRPVLDVLGSKVLHVGQRGAGAATKLAVNGLVHGLNVALSEALVLAEKAGVDRKLAYEAFAGGAGGAPFVQYKRAAYENPEDAAVAFSLDLVSKDLQLITDLARRVGAPALQASAGLDIVRNAIENGFGDRDMSALAVFLRGDAA